MKINKKGFTLIELLVVVLIIGILAAVALPMYNRAVVKTRLMEGLSVLRSLAESSKRYYMAHGKSPCTASYDSASLDKLDVTLDMAAASKKFKIWYWGAPVCGYLYLQDIKTGLLIYYSLEIDGNAGINRKDQIICRDQGNEEHKKYCAMLGKIERTYGSAADGYNLMSF
jgi:prepilin-type N-terminal cleavage/methylation domain-containing protein